MTPPSNRYTFPDWLRASQSLSFFNWTLATALPHSPARTSSDTTSVSLAVALNRQFFVVWAGVKIHAGTFLKLRRGALGIGGKAYRRAPSISGSLTADVHNTLSFTLQESIDPPRSTDDDARGLKQKIAYVFGGRCDEAKENPLDPVRSCSPRWRWVWIQRGVADNVCRFGYYK